MAEKRPGHQNYAQLAAMNTKFAEQLDEALKAQAASCVTTGSGRQKKLLG